MSVQPPRPRLPPLNALRAFEAAARHESFLRAAEELGVTAGAVAQQVKALEAWLRYPLFIRLSQGLRLTERGRAVLPALGGAFDALGLAVQEMRAASLRQEIRIAALPCLAQLWLAPRLARLRAAFPGLQVSVTAQEQPPNMRREPFELALFYLDSPVPGTEAVVLADDTLFPVCSPALLQAQPLDEPRDLARHVLLHDTAWADDWPAWLGAAGVAGIDPARGPAFSLYSLALQAAIEGGGVLIGRATLVEDPIRRGLLAAPLGLCLPAATRLTLLVPERLRHAPPMPELMAWMRAEAAGG